jgi:hypothetical protein
MASARPSPSSPAASAPSGCPTSPSSTSAWRPLCDRGSVPSTGRRSALGVRIRGLVLENPLEPRVSLRALRSRGRLRRCRNGDAGSLRHRCVAGRAQGSCRSRAPLAFREPRAAPSRSQDPQGARDQRRARRCAARWFLSRRVGIPAPGGELNASGHPPEGLRGASGDFGSVSPALGRVRPRAPRNLPGRHSSRGRAELDACLMHAPGSRPTCGHGLRSPHGL